MNGLGRQTMFYGNFEVGTLRGPWRGSLVIGH